MKHRTPSWLAILSRALSILGLLAAVRGDPTAAQARPDQFAPRVNAPAPVLSTATTTRFAVIGDYGWQGANEAAVAAMVSGWDPDFIITLGDNNYDAGAQATIDPNIGQYYGNFIYPYTGSYTSTAATNKFFPALGNHDWDGASGSPLLPTPYLDYFTLPPNERYYDFIWGPVHFFALDSDAREPDGITQTSTQAAWLERRLAFSTAKWRVVYMHHPPYSSGSPALGSHGSTPNLQWPYRAWGATAVLAGHDHFYERILKNDFPYFVNGLGGKSNAYAFGAPVAGSAYRVNNTWGAMSVTADDAQIKFEFWAITNTLTALDTYTVTTPSTSNRAYIPLIQR